MLFLQKAASFLNRKSTFLLLLSLTVLLSIVLFMMNKDVVSGDHFTYLYYIKGFKKGWYTYWYFFDEYVPDTFRNPGYPLFLYGLSLIYDSLLFIQLVQFFMLMTSIGLMIKVIECFDNSYILKNLFLLFTSINFVILSYASQIYPETLVMFLVTIIVYIEVKNKEESWKKIIILVLLYGFLFQVRPVIFFLPFIRFAYFFFKKKQHSILKNASFIALFILTLLPYGFWNLKQHKVFKITPLEGGAGVFYMGYWSPKMIGHLQDRYFRIIMFEDLFVNFTKKEEVPENIKRFNNEWDSIEKICVQYLSAEEIKRSKIMKEEQYTNLFPTYNAKYTMEREKIIQTLGLKYYLSDWKYTLKLKTYSFFRIWFSGYNLREDFRTITLSNFALMCGFLTTFSTLLLFVIYFSYSFFKNRKNIIAILLPLCICLYFDVFHLPFTIQSRYTIPVRLLFVFCLAYLVYKTHFSKYYTNESHKNL